MIRVKHDCLVLDRGLDVEPKDRFICIIAKDGLVNYEGVKSKEAQKIATETIVAEAIKAGAKVISETGCVVGGDKRKYLNDAILAFNGGDIIFEKDEVGQFMLKHGLAEPANI